MKTVQILESTDIIDGEDWCRPLEIVSMSGGMSDYYSFRSEYSGTPENNAKWVKVKHVFGKCWFGEQVGVLIERMKKEYEFVRGEPPKSHRLNMKNYNTAE